MKCIVSLSLLSSASALNIFASKPKATAVCAHMIRESNLCFFSYYSFRKVQKVLPAPINFWVPDASQYAYGLPGVLDPVGVFDPLQLLPVDVDGVKRFREAEVTHGRVAMLASIGFLVAENFHPLFGLDGKEILSIDSLTEVRQVFPSFFEILVVAIGGAELFRANAGWVSPYTRISKTKAKVLEDSYYPGDIGFDPLGLKPTTADEFVLMQTKELQNGRLAMLSIAGFVAQELVDHKPILLNDFGL